MPGRSLSGAVDARTPGGRNPVHQPGAQPTYTWRACSPLPWSRRCGIAFACVTDVHVTLLDEQGKVIESDYAIQDPCYEDYWAYLPSASVPPGTTITVRALAMDTLGATGMRTECVTVGEIVTPISYSEFYLARRGITLYPFQEDGWRKGYVSVSKRRALSSGLSRVETTRIPRGILQAVG